MDAELYNIEGKPVRSMVLPAIFSLPYREDLVRRALSSEQSNRYQPQARDLLAGLRTTAVYIGKYSAAYRRGRHMGIAIRPRQKLGGGAMGDVRRIPSATKGRRSHPPKLEKIIVENINRKEYVRALESAIAGCALVTMIKGRQHFTGKTLPIIIDNKIESVEKTKDLIKILNALGLKNELEKSHIPSIRKGMKRNGRQRHFRRSVLIVANNASKVEKAGRNIAGVEVASIDDLSIEKLAPGVIPRITIWSEDAVKNVEKELEKQYLAVATN
jgi:large subunit ribosomal protein L4e